MAYIAALYFFSWVHKLLNFPTISASGSYLYISANDSYFSSFFGFLAVLVFEHKASHLLGRGSTSWFTLPALFQFLQTLGIIVKVYVRL
jgi:hypothetical protein